MAELKIERLGGLGGFGLPGSRVKSEGRVDLAELDEEKRRGVEALFAAGGKASAMPDGFRYRLALTGDEGEKVIELPESEVPAWLAQSVKDELR